MTSGLPLRVSHRMTGTSPPGPLRCGSTTCTGKGVAQAASKALPPFSSAPMPPAVAIQWVDVTTPKVPSISGRVVKGLGLMLLMRPVALSFDQCGGRRPSRLRALRPAPQGGGGGESLLENILLRGLAQRRLRVDHVIKLGALPLRAGDALLGGKIRRRADLVAPGAHAAQALQAHPHP